jgi:hypothetical protein
MEAAGLDLDDARGQAVDLHRRKAVRLGQVTQLMVRVLAPALHRTGTGLSTR